MGEQSTDYFKMKQVEFYEFLGRVASLRFSSKKQEPLHTKVEKLLDMILPAYGMERGLVGGEAHQEATAFSDSEDSVDIEELDPEITLMLDKEEQEYRGS